MLDRVEAVSPATHVAMEDRTEPHWVDVCALSDIVPGTGVAALVCGNQVAVVRWTDGTSVFALSNYDPFSKAFVLSRGIVGDRGGVKKIASPIFKQSFDLETGECLDDATIRLQTYRVRVTGGRILLEARPAATTDRS